MKSFVAVASILLCQLGTALAQSNDARQELNKYLAGIGAAQLARRAQSVAAVRAQMRNAVRPKSAGRFSI
jgi:hypothetical protein